MFIELPKATPRQLPPEGNHALFLEKIVIFGTFKSERRGWMDSIRAYFEFQYVRERREDGRGEAQPIRIGRTIYGSRNVSKFVNELILDYPEAKENGKVKIGAVLGRVFNCIITHEPTKRDPSVTVANLARISSSVDKSVYEKKGFTILSAPQYFNILQNLTTGWPYASAAALVSCETFKALPSWMQEKVGETVEYSKFADAANYRLVRDDDKNISLAPLNAAAASEDFDLETKDDLPW